MKSARRGNVTVVPMRSLRPILVSVCILYACQPAPETKRVQNDSVCSLAPGLCEKTCAGCDDMSACYRNGGECPGEEGTPIYFRDFVDKGDDIFGPGCHFSFSDAACTQNGTFVNGDSCASATVLVEYTLTLPCHAGCAEPRECDLECLFRGLGTGKCVRVPHFCGPNQNSARCVCEREPPPPEPVPSHPT